jgi:hypothetical protein
VEAPSFITYLIIFGAILVSHYINRHQRKERQRPEDRTAPDVSQESHRASNLDDRTNSLFDDNFSSDTEFTPRQTSEQQASTLGKKAVHGSAYRSLTEFQDAPPNWKIQKRSLKKSAHRAQFKNPNDIRKAVISVVVLSPCRSDSPYR